MNPQTSFGFAGIVAHLTPVRFISTGVGFTIRQTRMLLTCDAIDASGIIVWMLFLHMYFQRLLIFVMPIALGTFEGFAAVSSRIPSNAARHPRTIEYHVTIGALNSSLSAIYMIWAGSNSGT